MRIIIVGGVAGGMSAATRLRRLEEDAEIIVLERGPYVSFANCGLPYYLGGEILKRDDLILQTPERLRKRFNLDVRVESEVIHIDIEKKKVRVQTETETYELGYDKLILSPGAKPIIPNIVGIENATNVFSVRSIPDIDRMEAFLKATKAKHALIIGAGFIGLEMAENLKKRGLHVSVVERASQVLPSIDEEMAIQIETELRKHNIDVFTNTSVQEIKENIVSFETKKTLIADIIISAIGVRADSGLAENSGIVCSPRGSILVDENYETSVKDVYAVGDAITVKHWITKEDVMLALASPANRQGRQVADIIHGLERKNKGSLGTAIVRVFDKVIASTGLNEKQLREWKKVYGVIHMNGRNHVKYYPNSTTILVKLLFDRSTGELYGAQAVGEDGVDKRMDVIATAIKGNLTVFDLPELELSYAPPFGSAKDPVNLAGYAAMNLVEGLSDNVQWHELEQFKAEGAQLIDVRDPDEYATAHIKGFVNIPLGQLRVRNKEIRKDVLSIVSCQSGQRSYIAERILKQKGHLVKNLDGAFSLYQSICSEEIEAGEKL